MASPAGEGGAAGGAVGGPHVVAVPCPLQGHTVPFMQLCQLLAKQGIRVTFVSTPRFQPPAAAAASIHLALLHDGLPTGYRVASNDLSTYLRHVELLHGPFHALVEEMLADSATPPITCLISDSHLGWVQEVANAFALPRICFLTSSTTEFSVLFHQPLLLSQGILPFKDGGESEDVIRSVPGVPPTKRSEFPSFLQVQDASDFEFQYFMRQIARVAEADRLLVSSFHDLEAQVLQILGTKLNIQPIGPLLLQDFHNDAKVDPCEKWLDAQPPNSVIYIAFGTLANLEQHEVEAIAGGLELTKSPFLWAFREDTVFGVPNPFPPGFKDTCNGLVVTWTHQQRILKHPSIGAFVTHCGWGSTLEAISMGVPLLCWPLYGDQLLNCNLLVEQWQVGVKIAPGVANRRQSLTRDHVASAITTIMSSSMYRLNMINLQALAHRACGPDGSSKRNFSKLVNDLYTLSDGLSKTSVE